MTDFEKTYQNYNPRSGCAGRGPRPADRCRQGRHGRWHSARSRAARLHRGDPRRRQERRHRLQPGHGRCPHLAQGPQDDRGRPAGPPARSGGRRVRQGGSGRPRLHQPVPGSVASGPASCWVPAPTRSMAAPTTARVPSTTWSSSLPTPPAPCTWATPAAALWATAWPPCWTGPATM